MLSSFSNATNYNPRMSGGSPSSLDATTTSMANSLTFNPFADIFSSNSSRNADTVVDSGGVRVEFEGAAQGGSGRGFPITKVMGAGTGLVRRREFESSGSELSSDHPTVTEQRQRRRQGDTSSSSSSSSSTNNLLQRTSAGSKMRDQNHGRSTSASSSISYRYKGVGPLGLDGDEASSSGVTRPYLTRVLSEFEGEDGLGEGEGEDLAREGRRRKGREEKVVLVHEIQPKDSLPGVSLKYGISMADLRRANKLWTTDSIHLRKVLYIPIENAKAALALGVPWKREGEHDEWTVDRVRDDQTKASMENLINFASETSSSITTPTSENEDERSTSFGGLSRTSSGSDDESNSRKTKGGRSTIRRIPASQLSFFPPPSRRPLVTRISNGDEDNLTNGTRHRHSRFATIHSGTASSFFPPSNSSLVPSPPIGHSFTSPAVTSSPRTLSSILSSIPLARDAVIARLSLDSNRSSSERSDELEVELGDVTGCSGRTRGKLGADEGVVVNGNGRSMSRVEPRPSLPEQQRKENQRQNGSKTPTLKPAYHPPPTHPLDDGELEFSYHVTRSSTVSNKPNSGLKLGLGMGMGKKTTALQHPLSSSTPVSYRSHTVRTNQLEPTEGMRVPSSLSSTLNGLPSGSVNERGSGGAGKKGRTRRVVNVKDIDFAGGDR